MGVSRLRAFLQRHQTIALDTSIFIYQLEANSKYIPLTDAIFSWIESGQSRAVACTIAMTELLVLPHREANRLKVEEHYALLSTYPNLEWVAPTLEIADLAACIRGFHNLKTPDALHAATAIRSGATGLLANDSAFERVDAYQTLLLDSLL